MTIAQRHLAPGGILTFNSTSSPDALRTASDVFSHAYRWSNFIYASDHDFRPGLMLVPERLLLMDKITGGQFLGDNSPAMKEAVTQLQRKPFIDLDRERNIAGREIEVITDDNMITEYAHGRSLW